MSTEPLTDAELIALSALVVAHAAEVRASNEWRLSRGEVPAYDGCQCQEADRLAEELQRRGVLGGTWTR